MKGYFSEIKTLNFWKEILIVIFGTLVASAAAYYFIIPSKVILGSVTGLAMVLSDLLEGVGVALRASTVILILNTLLIVLALIFLGGEVGLKTVVASVLLGPFIDLFDSIYPYTNMVQPGNTTIMGDPMYDLLAFILLIGASQAILFRINASTGGLDVVALIMNRYLHLDIGASVSVAGILVCLMGGFIHPASMVIIGMIGTWFNGIVIDYFTASLNKKKRVCIISPDYEKIRDYIIRDLSRGCSMYSVVGGYSREASVEIQALLTNSEFAKLMEFMRRNGFNAFTTAGNCSEVYGTWRGRRKSAVPAKPLSSAPLRTEPQPITGDIASASSPAPAAPVSAASASALAAPASASAASPSSRVSVTPAAPGSESRSCRPVAPATSCSPDTFDASELSNQRSK